MVNVKAMNPSYGTIEQKEAARPASSPLKKHRTILAVIGTTLLVAALVGTYHYAAATNPQAYEMEQVHGDESLDQLETELDSQQDELEELAAAPAPGSSSGTKSAHNAHTANASPAGTLS